MSDDTNLEEAFRAGLQRHAEDVDTTVDLLGPAQGAARGRRRRRVVASAAIGLAAAALVTAVVVQGPGGSDGPDHTGVVDEGPTEPMPAEWRTEAWHGLAVEVPASWGWGTTPITMSFDKRTPLLCGGPGEMARANGTHLVNPDRDEPWVGRPVMLSDDCMGPPFPAPTAPYVWLGADLAPGTVDVGGYVQETVEVDGTTLTVASRDPGLRERIISSAGTVDSGCAPSLDSAPVVGSMLTEGLRNPSSALVCAYAPTDDNTGPFELVYATELDEAEATVYHSQVYDGGFESAPEFCAGGGERVLVTIRGEDPYGGAGSEVTQDTVVDPVCRQVSGSPGMVSPLSEKGMKSWSRNGAQVTLAGWIGNLG